MKLIDCLEIHSKKYNIYLKIWQKENIKRAYLDSSLIADLTNNKQFEYDYSNGDFFYDFADKKCYAKKGIYRSEDVDLDLITSKINDDCKCCKCRPDHDCVDNCPNSRFWN